ncbi:MAG TPA: translocation/assembly module TamB domain-containing protein [Gemmatimonadaceae bacterium]|nr:translocation/assembly module TamB domain-containing protein [Gemmatimonadaceae bacterium]
MRRWVMVLLIVAGVLAAVTVVAVGVITSTDWGRERVRRLALSVLDERAEGSVQIGRVSGNLLRGVTLHDIVITDPDGGPFIAIEEASTGYMLRAFLARRVVLEDVRLVRPVIVLDRAPGGEWNFRRIFASDTARPPAEREPGWGDWVVFGDVEVIDGRMVVRTPWEPDLVPELGPAARDSAIAAVLAGEGRSEVVRVAGGFQRVMDFRSIHAVIDEIRLNHPRHESSLIAVDSLSMIAEPFRPPVVEILALAGAFEFTGDSLWFTGMSARLPGSAIAGGGAYEFETEALRLELRGDPVALADLRWLYPRLPSEGAGSLDFAMRTTGDTSTYLARGADIVVRDSRLAGDFGLTLAAEAVFHDTDLRMTTFDTRLIEQLVPGLDMQVSGTLTGRAALAGPVRAMHVDADLVLDERGSGRSRLVAIGEAGFGDGIGFRARNLRLRALPFQVRLVQIVAADFAIGGTLTGSARLDGSTSTQLATHADLVHLEAGSRSHVVGDGLVRFGAVPWVDIDAQARPLALATIARLMPVDMRGVVSGPIRLRGSLRDLEVDTRLRVSGGGELHGVGRLDLASAAPAYDMRLGFWVLDLSAIFPDAPVTSLSAQLGVDGRGTDPETMEARLYADVTTSHWDDVAVDSAVARVAIGGGELRIDSLHVRAPSTRLDAEGTFGLAAGREGTLTYRLDIDSLGDFARWLPLDSGVVEPRPAQIARARRTAREEARRRARETEVERALAGAPPPVVEPDLPPAIPRDTITGSVFAAGTLRGSIDRFDLRGRASVLDLTLLGHTVESGRLEYVVGEGGTDRAGVIVAAEAGGITTGGFQFDTLEARVVHRHPSGDIVLRVQQGDAREYAANASYSFSLGQNELTFSRLALRFDTLNWVATREGAVRWGPRGVEVDDIELRSGELGRIFVNGLLPTEGESNLQFIVDNFEIAHAVAFLQSDIPAEGLVSVSGTLQGTAAAPRFAGAAGLVGGRYGGTVLPQLNATFQYEDQSLTSRLVASRAGGAPLAVADAFVPVNLAFAEVSGPRVLDRPLRVDVTADSLPLDALPQFTDAVTEIRGRVIGSLSARGSARDPEVVGALALDLASFGVAATGTRVRDIAGQLRLEQDTVVIDSLVGWAGGPIRISGGLGFADLLAPSFDLRLRTENALVLDNEQGRLRADADLTLTGPFERAVVDGTARIRQGVLYVQESADRDVISARDPAVFDIVDTSLVELDVLLPEESTLLRNLQMNVALRVDRNTWVRSTNANVEVNGDLSIVVDQRRRAIALEGFINTDRGEYTFFSRRFQIVRGSATFVGAGDIDPNLQITGNYEVPIPGREALNIRIIIGGTLSTPKLSLESDAQPPISQTDLMGYLAFGRSGSSLFRAASGLSGASGSGELVGAGAALAGRQLTGIALGVAVSELEGQASRQLGLDVFNISPGELPPEFWRADIEAFLLGTEIEAGRYINPRTFVALQAYPDLRIPGVRAEYRFGTGFRLEGNYATRYLLSEPTLAESDRETINSFGALLVREWRFSSRLRRREAAETGEPAGAAKPGTRPRGGGGK